MLPWLLWVVGPVLLISFMVTAAAAWRGTFRPNLVTWGLWSATPLIAGSAALVAGAGLAAAPTLVAGGGTTLIVVAALASPHRTLWPVRRHDLGCAALAVAALVGWALTRDPLVAVVFAIAADAAASAPTLHKSWTRPGTETAVAYVPILAGGVAGLGSVTDWVVTAWLFHAYMVASCCLFIVVIVVRGRRTTEPAPIPAV